MIIDPVVGPYIVNEDLIKSEYEHFKGIGQRHEKYTLNQLTEQVYMQLAYIPYNGTDKEKQTFIKETLNKIAQEDEDSCIEG